MNSPNSREELRSAAVSLITSPRKSLEHFGRAQEPWAYPLDHQVLPPKARRDRGSINSRNRPDTHSYVALWRPFNGLIRPCPIMLSHPKATYRPPKRAEDLPKPNMIWIHRNTSDRLVPCKQVFHRSKPADWLISAKRPRVRADPAEISHRIADVSHFPIQTAEIPAGSSKKLPLKIVMYEGEFAGIGQVISRHSAA